MDKTDDIIRGYQRLIDLLEEEQASVSNCLKGELLDAYQALLRKEIQRLKDQQYAVRAYHL